MQMRMDTSLRRIEVSSEPGKIYFLRVTWEEDLGSGFSVDLCDGQSVWRGKVSEEEVSKEAQEMEMKRDIYVDELCQALTAGGKQTNNYSFDLSKDPADSHTLHFSYEKVLKDVFFKLGSAELHTISKPIEVIKELINHGLDRSSELRARNEHLLGENERLGRERDYVTEELKKYVQAKEVLEQDLYTRFVLVLNEKKAKIRNLQEKLKQAQEEVESELQHRGDTSTVESKAPAEQDYEGSTDEESIENENPRPSTSARGWDPPSRNQVAAISPQRNLQPQPGAPQTQKTSLMTSSPQCLWHNLTVPDCFVVKYIHVVGLFFLYDR
ncbi:DNA repair protein XRCC4-like isoform X3 [Polyodon spathula]|uniref:DNA repair protein XRCC4-like isoform X3 n=1 Tax=Polyodon spathula TaxID=7913 RepID=UPI001B7E1539|nr:DNA repair protein XRCC4-like isoform X3 [Polyodon spathula]